MTSLASGAKHGYALARDIEGMGGQVRVCQPRDVPTPFEPIIEIVSPQIASCRLAETKGIDPGDFRYATLVTTAETGFGCTGPRADVLRQPRTGGN